VSTRVDVHVYPGGRGTRREPGGTSNERGGGKSLPGSCCCGSAGSVARSVSSRQGAAQEAGSASRTPAVPTAVPPGSRLAATSVCSTGHGLRVPCAACRATGAFRRDGFQAPRSRSCRSTRHVHDPRPSPDSRRSPCVRVRRGSSCAGRARANPVDRTVPSACIRSHRGLEPCTCEARPPALRNVAPRPPGNARPRGGLAQRPRTATIQRLTRGRSCPLRSSPC
jgi:hypothetical protein